MTRYFTIINLILLTTTIYFGVDIFYKISTAQLEKETYVDGHRVVSTPLEREIASPFSNYNAIMDRNLFKTQKKAMEKAIKVDVDSLKPTELQLKLLGTVSGNSNKVYAVIQDEKNRQQNLYKPGDTIQDATLKMILREKVVLSVAERDEILEIEKTDSTSGRGSDRVSSRFSNIGMNQSPRGPAEPPVQKISLSRSMIEEATQNINKLMTDARIRPYFENGNPEGLILSSINNNSIYQKMGLRRGDIITGIDGNSIRSVDDALKLYESLKSATNLKIEIKRRGQQRTLDYNIQ